MLIKALKIPCLYLGPKLWFLFPSHILAGILLVTSRAGSFIQNFGGSLELFFQVSFWAHRQHSQNFRSVTVGGCFQVSWCQLKASQYLQPQWDEGPFSGAYDLKAIFVYNHGLQAGPGALFLRSRSCPKWNAFFSHVNRTSRDFVLKFSVGALVGQISYREFVIFRPAGGTSTGAGWNHGFQIYW
jgi:hypothetical protein